MDIKLSRKITNPTIICGFPGFGLVGTISTEYLLEHLKCEFVGSHWFEDLSATVAIHDQKLIHPIGFYYNKQYNILIIHSILATSGIEWMIANLINDVAKQTKAKEIISLEGVGAPGMVPGGMPDMEEEEETPKAENNFFYVTEKKTKENMAKYGVKPLKEGIIIGVTSALMLKTATPLTALFSEVHSSLPDSKAAASLIVVLDKYLGLKIDPEPLLETAKKFEEKIRGIMEKGVAVQKEANKKQLSYVG